jgi:HptB-dependent secretion and biofilm anti anti-sigma factor
MIRISSNEGTTTIHVDGRFDYRCVAQFRAALDTGARTWHVDLAQASYVDSAGLGMLLLLRERVGNDAARVRLHGAKGQILDVLMMAKFDRLFALDTARDLRP